VAGVNDRNEFCGLAGKEARMSRNLVTSIEAKCYVTQLQGCFALWLGAMEFLRHSSETELACEDIIAAIGPIARAHRQLVQLTVTPQMAAAHQAALTLLQSAMDALDAIAAGRGRPAVRDLSEQLAIFQTELVLFAERAGLLEKT
jgi:hypothetical protein